MIKGVLFQEELKKDPFWMLVACSLVNLTTWKSAEPVFEKIRRDWPTPEDLEKADPNKIFKYVQKLGFGQIRKDRLPAMAAMWLFRKPETAKDVMMLPGCGKYAADSWAIFVEGRRDVSPTDKELIAWLEKEKLNERKSDSE